MNPVEKLSTGIPGFDALAHGGLPRGRSTLVCGRSGTCKTIFALQAAANLARRGVKPFFISIEETPEDLCTTGDSLGFAVSALLKENKMLIADLSQPHDGPTFVSGEYDLSGLLHRVEAAIKNQGVQAVFLDSATALFSPRPPDESLRSHFFQLVHAMRRLGVTFVVTAESPRDYGTLTTLGVEDYVCDAVVILRNLVDGERRRRSVEIQKYRRSAHYKGEYPLTITNKGIIVFPLDANPRSDHHVSERFSSGLEGLDDLNHGGWLRDAIVLVRGPSGSGKTTLAGMYARAGAMRGERVVYYGFEEPRQILTRNFASLQMPVEDLERAGNLRVHCRYPEATSPEDMLVDLRVGLDEYQPSLVVLDSISSIEHSTSAHGFRQFMIGLASILREHNRSALLTQTIASQTGAEHAAPYLSTIADAILLLDYRVDEPELQRSIRVLKMRGSPHGTERRRMAIVPGGLRVEPISAQK